MGSLFSPKPPKTKPLAPAATAEPPATESKKIAENEDKKRLAASSSKGSVRGGAVNRDYYAGAKTRQGQ